MKVLNDRSLPVRSGAPSSSPPLPTLVEEIGSRECCWRGRHKLTRRYLISLNQIYIENLSYFVV